VLPRSARRGRPRRGVHKGGGRCRARGRAPRTALVQRERVPDAPRHLGDLEAVREAASCTRRPSSSRRPGPCTSAAGTRCSGRSGRDRARSRCGDRPRFRVLAAPDRALNVADGARAPRLARFLCARGRSSPRARARSGKEELRSESLYNAGASHANRARPPHDRLLIVRRSRPAASARSASRTTRGPEVLGVVGAGRPCEPTQGARFAGTVSLEGELAGRQSGAIFVSAKRRWQRLPTSRGSTNGPTPRGRPRTGGASCASP
jgi:hypothetical protein